MKFLSNLALVAALAVTGAAYSAPAAAQDAKKQEAPQRQFKLNKAERNAIAPFQAAVNAKDWAAAAAALPAAQAASKGTDARYIVAHLQLQMALANNDKAAQSAALDALIASGGVGASELPALLRGQAGLAIEAKDYARAEAIYAQLLQANPNDVDTIVNLARLKSDTKKPAEALTLLDRAIAAQTASGKKADQTWYKYALKLAYDAKSKDAARIGRQLVTAYPTAENWRDALLIYREALPAADKPLQLDLLRLMRSTGSLSSERDWYELAEALDNSGYPGETKAVLDEGSSLRKINLKKPVFGDLVKTSSARIADDRASLAGQEAKANAAANGTLALKIADAYYGYRDYAKAIALYQTALKKGGVDANIVNTRLGVALVAAGRKAEAEAAFKAVTGPRAELAGYWLLWLSQKA